MLEGVNEPHPDGPPRSVPSRASTKTSKTNRKKRIEADMTCSSLPQDHRIMVLKRQHTEHLLEVLRSADEEENDRQKKLGRATNKADIIYLKKRFKAERRKTRRHIVNLLKDAEILRSATARRTDEVKTHPESLSTSKALRNSARCSRAREGGKNASVSRSCGGKAFATILEPKLGGDPNVIDTEKMRFLQYMNKHLDNQKVPVRRKGVWGKASGVPRNYYDKFQRPRLSGETTGFHVASAAARATGRINNALDKNASSRSAGELDRGRIRLLQQKRKILQDLEGVIRRQAEALDRLAKGDTTGKQIDSGTRETKTFRGGFSGTQDKGASSGGTKLQREEKGSSGRNTSKVSGFTAKLPPVLLPLPPRPPDNATSTFLALGGRWGDREGAEGSLRGSVATSASFATYCDRRQKGYAKCDRVGRRPREVPPLPIKGTRTDVWWLL